MAAQTRLIYEFDDFQLEPDERKLTRRGEIVPLHGKAFEMLFVLIRNRGRLLTKDELFQLVWPDQIVEESNLTVNMSAIRRALGERASRPRYITTVSGRGYRFSGDVRQFANEALTIERKSFARLTVEQEETESGTSLVPSAAQIATAIRRATSHPLLVSVTAVILTIAGGGAWLKLHRVSAAPLPWSNLTMRRFAVRGGIPFRVAISPDGNSLVYVQRINNKPSLWLGQVETNSSTLIENRDNITYNAVTYSRNGEMVYVTETDQLTSATKLVRMPSIGGPLEELATNVHSVVTFSPDGRQLAFVRRAKDQSSIIVTDADGRNEHTLVTRNAPQQFAGYGLSWSPDGKFISVAANEGPNKRDELLLISTVDGTTTRLGSRDWGCVKNLVWRGTGDGLLAIVSTSPVARRSEIWFVPYPAGEPRRITNDLNEYYPQALSVSSSDTIAVLNVQIDSQVWLAPDGDGTRARVSLRGTPMLHDAVDGLTWTPDGHFLFSGYVGDAQNISEAAPDGSNRKQLTSNTGDAVDRQMTVSADNRYIVFQSNRSGSFEIWRINRDGSNLKQLTSGGNNFQPSISPDSKSIVYASERGGTSTLLRIAIDGGEPKQLTRYGSSKPQISPDGKHIAYVGSSDAMPLYLGIVAIDGGEPEKVFPLTQKPQMNLARQFRWAPDGKAILYTGSGSGMWRQRLDRDTPEPVKGFEESNVFQLGWSFDGKNLAYTRGTSIQEILLLQNQR